MLRHAATPITPCLRRSSARRLAPWLAALGCCFVLVAERRAPAHPNGHSDGAARSPYPSAEQFRPTPLPDRVVLTWSGDPATSLDITYRTDAGGAQTLCEWIEADRVIGDHRDGDIADANRTQGTSEPFQTNLGPCRMHSVRLRDLAPKTKYAYRVGDGVNWTAWHHATTASDRPEPFEFLYFGDAQNAVRALWSRVRREAHAEAPRAAFALHAGDLINRANEDGEWGEWHGAAGWLNATVPTVATPGNHEYARGVLSRRLSRHWRPQFSFPENGPEGLEESCYWFDYQGVRFVSLNSNERAEEQAVWLDETLGRLPAARWTIVTFHHPIFSAAKDRDNPRLRELWKPLFDKHGVHLALQGHDHAYARSGLGGPKDAEAAPGNVDAAVGTENVGVGARGAAGQTVYVVSVSGPKSYPLTEAWDVSRSGSGVQLYQTIRVERDAIRYDAFRATGELYDAFTIRQDDEGLVTLEERTPSTPEVRR